MIGRRLTSSAPHGRAATSCHSQQPLPQESLTTSPAPAQLANCPNSSLEARLLISALLLAPATRVKALSQTMPDRLLLQHTRCHFQDLSRAEQLGISVQTTI